MARISGHISLPGDKSISHRAALLSALRLGESSFSNFNFNQDCSATLDCLASFGIKWHLEKDVLHIKGKEITDWQPPVKALDARNSGTTARLISGILANLDFPTLLTGDSSLSKRPMGRILKPLLEMGANIKAKEELLPLSFFPVNSLHKIKYVLPVASAQVKSAILLAGLFAEGTTEVVEKIPSRDHTERMLKLDQKKNNDGSVSNFSSSNSKIPDQSMAIPGDFSSAAFYIAAALLLPGSELKLSNISLNPSRTGLLQILQKMGADINIEQLTNFPEPTGDITVRYSSLSNISIPDNLIPNIIDEIPILAIIAAKSRGNFELRNAAELRNKESDRISMIVENLHSIGVPVVEFDDGFALNGPVKFSSSFIKANGDHRIAMAFAIANLLTDDDISIDNPECTSVSFPDFWDLLTTIVVK